MTGAHSRFSCLESCRTGEAYIKQDETCYYFLHRSHTGARILKEKQAALNVPDHKLVTDVETHWNFTYLMDEGFFEQRVTLHATFTNGQFEGHRDVHVYREMLKTMASFNEKNSLPP